MNYNKIAESLDQAAQSASPLQQISIAQPIDLQEAYAIQSISMSRRYMRGEKRLGLKMGFTSKAKMEQMGVHDIIWGRLTDEMYYENGGELSMKKFIHPRAEPEIAFRLAQDINEIIPLDKVNAVVDGLTSAIEIIDSRYENFKFSLEDVIADNCSSSGFIIGSWKPATTPIRDITISLSIDGEVIHSGNSDAILGNPWESLEGAIRLAIENGEPLKKGDIILAGAATPATYIKSGQTIETTAEGFDPIFIKVTD